jgi:hypothetical protein
VERRDRLTAVFPKFEQVFLLRRLGDNRPTAALNKVNSINDID